MRRLKNGAIKMRNPIKRGRTFPRGKPGKACTRGKRGEHVRVDKYPAASAGNWACSRCKRGRSWPAAGRCVPFNKRAKNNMYTVVSCQRCSWRLEKTFILYLKGGNSLQSTFPICTLLLSGADYNGYISSFFLQENLSKSLRKRSKVLCTHLWSSMGRCWLESTAL